MLFVLLLANSVYSQNCDSMKWCSHNAIRTTITTGKLAQYTEVDTSWRIRAIDTALTFEAWLKPQSQPGKRVYVGGIWGPNKDNNDVWVCYIENTTIYFALSQDNSFRGDVDNTVASVDVPNLYTRGWVHLACVWDGVSQEARIIIDGYEFARAKNAAYPVTVLHKQDNKQLPLLFGASNALYDDTVRFRSFKGEMDEIRLWGRALSVNEIRCNRNRSLEGNESKLELYYRANDSSYIFDLCDATGNGHIGRLRSGARMLTSDRTVPATFSVSPPSMNATLICVDDTTFTFTITDTSFCGNSVYAFFYGGAAGLYSLSQSSFNLSQNVPQTFTVRINNATLAGDISTGLYIVNYNRCGDYLYIPLTVNRTTELSYSKNTIKFDTLYVGCTEKPYGEDSIRICNTSNRPLQITSASLKNPQFSWLPANGQPNLPLTLQPGDCWTVKVRMNNFDTSRTFYDTLRFVSDDKCPGSGFIPLEGRTQDVLVLLTPDAKRQIKQMNFEAVCPGQISNVQTFQWRNLIGENIYVDSVVMTNPAFFIGGRAYPVQLRVKTAYLPIAVRFRPPSPGPFTGQMRVYCNFKGCTIVRTIDFTGTGISVDVSFVTPNVLFGNVSIGKVGTQTATVICNGKDPRRMSAYLKVGDVFSITGGRSFTINPGQTQVITTSFRPREPKTYYDTLCIFDEQCYGTVCIPVSGTGVFEQLSFTPPYVSTKNVLGCTCRDDSVVVKNLTSSGIDITSDALNDPSGKYTLLNRIPTGILAPGQSFTYRLRYCPNDLNDERADRSYITINVAGGTKYEVLLEGTSIIPKLYVAPLVTYGSVEVGWNKLDSVLIENITSIPVHISSLTVPAGYTLVSTNPPLPALVDPRDSVWAYIRFSPTAAVNYPGIVTATIDTPCGRIETGAVTGRGTIVKLEVPISFINYGLTRPCDCVEREIPLPNKSNFVPITINDILVDSAGIANGNSIVYNWRSKLTGGNTTPYQIPPGMTDTLVVTFCPNVPAIPQNLLLNANLRIAASTPGWRDTFVTMLSGRREMNFRPNVSVVGFPPTRVDTNAQTQTVRIVIPDAFQNPSGDSIVFTGFAFDPDQNVFSAQECSGAPPPWVRYRGDTLCFRIDFKPRAPKKYEARMDLFTSYPCAGTDTTILVMGEGFAPAFGMQMAFDTNDIGGDTLHITTCDTLVVPVMITRDMPQDIIDMLFRITYDSALVQLLDVISPFTTDATVSDTGDGARALLKKARRVRAGYLAYVRFIPKGGPGQFPITLDEIDFDSDSLVTFKIVAGMDRGFVIIDDPEISISPLTVFDTVNIRDCKDQIVTVWNSGNVPTRFDSLSTLPPYHRVTASSIPYPTTLAPGDSIQLTVTFCPWMEGWIDTDYYAYTNQPCPKEDTGHVRSYGYAPPFPLTVAFDASINVMDTVGGMITDTIEVPVIVDRSIPLSPIDLRFDVTYNRRALMFISASSTYSTPTVTRITSGYSFELLGCDSVMKGEIMRMKFLVAVPDSVISQMIVSPLVFTSDSIMFIKPVPAGDTTMVKVDPKCNISSLNFTGGTNAITIPRPNPTTGRVELEIEFFEEIAPKLQIYRTTGEKVMTVLTGEDVMKGGRYRLNFDMHKLAAGSYLIVYEAGRYRATEKIVIQK
jgi:hypothetical protein